MKFIFFFDSEIAGNVMFLSLSTVNFQKETTVVDVEKFLLDSVDNSVKNTGISWIFSTVIHRHNDEYKKQVDWFYSFTSVIMDSINRRGFENGN